MTTKPLHALRAFARAIWTTTSPTSTPSLPNIWALENSQRRLLAVMREYCKPRLGMRARMWLDMTEDDEFDDNVERFVYELKQPPAA